MQFVPEMMAREANGIVFAMCVKASSATNDPVAAFLIDLFGNGNKPLCLRHESNMLGDIDDLQSRINVLTMIIPVH